MFFEKKNKETDMYLKIYLRARGLGGWKKDSGDEIANMIPRDCGLIECRSFSFTKCKFQDTFYKH